MRESNTKLIQCPTHKGDCKATLFCYPHRSAGVWKCNSENISDIHEHEEYGIEEVVSDSLIGGEHIQYQSLVYVCGGTHGCGVQIEGDPIMDKADALPEARAS